MVRTLQADMCHFEVDEPVEFAFVALGSLYAQSTSDLVTHFRSVAAALKPGGLYLMDWCVSFSPVFPVTESWHAEHNGVDVHIEFQASLVDPVEQIVQDSVVLAGTDAGTPFRVSSVDTKRIMFPQEFLLLVKELTEFEFIGWWNNWDLSDPIPSTHPINRPIAVLRKLESTSKRV
jgi:hypothetical protein